MSNNAKEDFFMRQFICIALCFGMLLFLFSGCRKTNTPDHTTNTGISSEDHTTASTTAEASDIEETLENTEASETAATPPLPTEVDTQTPTNTPADNVPATPKPGDSGPVKPTVYVPSSNAIAGGKWDGGPIIWEITSDGVLTFSGNHHIQGKPSYIWMDYADIITKVVFKEGIETIPPNAFKGMSNITTIELCSTLTVIYNSAFENCTALTSVTIPQNLNIISMFAFSGCTGLKSVSFAPGCTLKEIKDYAFMGSGLQSFTAPASLRTIGIQAFANCTSLNSVRLEGGINEIFARAFEGCTGLEHLVLGSSITYAGGHVFRNCNALKSLEYNTPVRIEFTGYTQLNKLVIGGTRTRTGCFKGCTALTSVTLNPNITEISPLAFCDCRSLTSITLPASLQIIGSGAFRDSGLTSITIPAQVTKIGFSSLAHAPLNEVIFTGNAPSFDIHTSFYSVSTTVYYPEGNDTWTKDVLQNYGGTLTWVAK